MKAFFSIPCFDFRRIPGIINCSMSSVPTLEKSPLMTTVVSQLPSQSPFYRCFLALPRQRGLEGEVGQEIEVITTQITIAEFHVISYGVPRCLAVHRALINWRMPGQIGWNCIFKWLPAFWFPFRAESLLNYTHYAYAVAAQVWRNKCPNLPLTGITFPAFLVLN